MKTEDEIRKEVRADFAKQFSHWTETQENEEVEKRIEAQKASNV